jgi:hypothetical protein
LHGPWFWIATRWLDDFESFGQRQSASKLEPWADPPPVGATVIDAEGVLYFSELATNAVKRRAPDGQITMLLQDSRAHRVDGAH